MKARHLLHALLVLAAPVANACSVTVNHFLYVNVVRLEGPRIEGLTWYRVYNMLAYEGDDRVLVSRVSGGRRYPVAKWDNGQICSFDDSGKEHCDPNRPNFGVKIEGLFGDWVHASNHRDDLKKVFVPLVVETGGREIGMTLRSWAVRNTRELRSLIYNKVAPCDLVNEVEEG